MLELKIGIPFKPRISVKWLEIVQASINWGRNRHCESTCAHSLYCLPVTALLKACWWLLALRIQPTCRKNLHALTLAGPAVSSVPFSCVRILLSQAHSDLLLMFTLPGPVLSPGPCATRTLFLRCSSEWDQGRPPNSLPPSSSLTPAPVFSLRCQSLIIVSAPLYHNRDCIS